MVWADSCKTPKQPITPCQKAGEWAVGLWTKREGIRQRIGRGRGLRIGLEGVGRVAEGDEEEVVGRKRGKAKVVIKV